MAYQKAEEVAPNLPGFIAKYSARRLNAALGYLSTEQYEKQHARPLVKDAA